MKKSVKGVIIGVASLICIALVVVLVVTLVGQKPLTREGNILARVNDQVLTLEEFKQQFEKIRPPARRGGSRPEMGQQMVEHWIETKLLSQEAKRRGIDESPDFVKKLEEVRERMITQMLIQEEMSKIEVSDEEIVEYFNRYRSRFRIPETVRVRHILVSTEAEAKEIQGRLNKGEEFEKLAQEVSTDTRTKQQGGDLGFLERTRCQRRYGYSFANAAFSLKEGDISEPIKSRRGYHLIKLEEKREAGEQTLDQVREIAKSRASREKMMKTRQEFIENLRKKAQIEKHLDLLRSAEGPPVIEGRSELPPQPGAGER